MVHDKEVRCISGKACFQLCLSKHCYEKSVVCADKKCQCRLKHNKNKKFCRFGQMDYVIQMTRERNFKNSDLYKWINQKLDELTKWIAEKRQSLYDCYDPNQLNFLEAVQSGNFDGLTGHKMYELVKDFDSQCNKLNKMTDQIKQCLENHWNSINSKMKEEVQAIKSTIIGLYKQECKGLYEMKIGSGFGLNSKVVTTQTERKIVTEMLNEVKRVSKYRLLYRASQNNFQVSKFWDRCHKWANTVTLVKTEFNKVCGGYTPLYWDKNKYGGNYEQDSSLKSFIFSVTEKTKLKLKQSQKSNAVYHSSSYGPTFGNGFDLKIINNANNSKDSYADIGKCYQNTKIIRGTKNAWNLFQGSDSDSKFKIKEWQVWEVVFQ